MTLNATVAKVGGNIDPSQGTVTFTIKDGSNNTIGDGGIEGGLNVISGNKVGIHITPSPDDPAARNDVLGNLIGTGIDGFSMFSNTQDGVWVDNAPATPA